MNWHRLRQDSPLKLVEYEEGRIPSEERLTVVQRVPIRRSQDSVERSVALVLADLAVLPNTTRINPMKGDLMREGTLAVIPVRPSEGLWQPELQAQGDGAPDIVEGPGMHPYVDSCLRDWRYWRGLGIYSGSQMSTIGRNARQMGGADIGVDATHPAYNFDFISRQNGVAISTLHNLISMVKDAHPKAPVHVHRQPLWEPAPERGPLGSRLALVGNKIPYQTVVDALEESEQTRVNNFYGYSFMGWRRALKRWQLQRAGQEWPEKASPWIGASTSLVKR